MGKIKAYISSDKLEQRQVIRKSTYKNYYPNMAWSLADNV